MRALVDDVLSAAGGRRARASPGLAAAGLLGAMHEESLGAARKARGVFYTPPHIVAHVVRHCIDPLLRHGRAGNIRLCDPACGSGLFLLAAYRRLLKTARPRGDGAAELLVRCIHGVDLDPLAVGIARFCLLLECAAAAPAGQIPRLPDLSANIRRGDSIVGPDCPARGAAALDWPAAFPRVFAGRRAGFDVLLGNPPWGQKAVGGPPGLREHLRRRYASLGGIFDLFRPFVERGLDLTRDGGYFGMVLPDIVLLKDYVPTRRLLLDSLALTRIDWWGAAFAGATIDAATVIGRKGAAPARHAVCVAVHGKRAEHAPQRQRAEQAPPLTRRVAQRHFREAPRHVFNLHLTAAARHTLAALARLPKLGEFFDIHEGVHSGNIRRELFVDEKLDDSCRQLLFGRDEIAPYSLRWAGRYIRLSAAAGRGRGRYANLGRAAWHRRAKLLVRRTGDRVIAAVDRRGRYASNNFFLVFPHRPVGLSLDGLAALLNSPLMTWYFRTIEPRTGRAFAELKIKHLRTFPLPAGVADAAACAALNRLGAARAALSRRPPSAAARASLAGRRRCAAARLRAARLRAARLCRLDAAIDSRVRKMLNVGRQAAAHGAAGSESLLVPVSPWMPVYRAPGQPASENRMVSPDSRKTVWCPRIAPG